MSEIRQRIAAHRQDALVLLSQLTSTARLYEGFCLAGAVRHLARTQALLAKELNGLANASERETASAAHTDQDDTPVDGIQLTSKGPPDAKP
jgi:hypothetical protein